MKRVNIKEIILNNPALSSTLITLLAVFIETIPIKNIFSLFLDNQLSTYFGLITIRLIIISALLYLFFYLGFKKESLFLPIKKWRDIWVIWPSIFLVAINFSDFFAKKLRIDLSNPFLIFVYTLRHLSTGFFEEILARGLLLFIFLNKFGKNKKGIYFSVIISNLIFGLAHFINLYQDHNILVFVLSQIIYAMFFGTFFAGLFLRNKTLWPVILIHSLFNFGGSIREIVINGGLIAKQIDQASTSVNNLVVATIVSFPFFLYGLFLLRKIKYAPLSEN